MGGPRGSEWPNQQPWPQQPPYQPGPPQFGPPPGFPPGYGPPIAPAQRGSRVGLIAAILLVLAAGLALAGSFVPLIVRRYTGSLAESIAPQTATAWGYTSDDVAERIINLDGVGLALGALVAIVGAVLLLVQRADSPGARQLGVAGGGLLAGAVVVVVSSIVAGVVGAGQRNGQEGGGDYSEVVDIGLGTWLVAGAGVLAVAALVLLMIPARPAVAPMPGAPPFAPPPPRQYGRYPG